jgi:periplasmic divalent cation tolerance protein
MEKIIQIVTTTDDRELSEKIGRELVVKRLAACSQVMGPITSTYRWKGRIEKTLEWLLIIKSKESLYQAIEDEIKRLHPYEVPEIIATAIEKGPTAYLQWVSDETV